MKQALLLSVPLLFALASACERPADRREGVGGGPTEESIERQKDRVNYEAEQKKDAIELQKEDAESRAKEQKDAAEHQKDMKQDQLDEAEDAVEDNRLPDNTQPAPRPLIP